MQQNVLSGRNRWSYFSETKQLSSSVAGGPSWLHPGAPCAEACTRGPVSMAQGEDTQPLHPHCEPTSVHAFDETMLTSSPSLLQFSIQAYGDNSSGL